MIIRQDTPQLGPTALSDNRTLSRFEWQEAGETSCVNYHHQGAVLVLDHSFVPETLTGRGVGSRMVKAVLDELLHCNQKIIVRCDFINHLIARNDAYKTLVQP